MEYYAAIKSDDVIIHAIMWLNLKNIMLIKRPVTKATHYMIPFIGNFQNKQIQRANHISDCQGRM